MRIYLSVHGMQPYEISRPEALLQYIDVRHYRELFERIDINMLCIVSSPCLDRLVNIYDEVATGCREAAYRDTNAALCEPRRLGALPAREIMNKEPTYYHYAIRTHAPALSTQNQLF